MYGRFISSLETIPRGYGIAYRAYNRDGSWCYPIPLNWIMRWSYSLLIRLRFPLTMTWYEQELHDVYARGFSDGQRHGGIR